MSKKTLLSGLFSLMVSCAVFVTGCESSSSDNDSGSSGGGNNAAVGHWKSTNFEGNPNSGFYWHFNDDGTFSLNKSTTHGGTRTGTYKVSGNKITGNGNSVNVGTFNISFTMDGTTFSGIFHEDWNGGKDVPITAVKQ